MSPSKLVVEGFVAKRLEPQSGSVRFLHSFPRIGKADSEETDQPSDRTTKSEASFACGRL